MSDAEIADRIVHKAKLWLDGGAMFGESGKRVSENQCGVPEKHTGRGNGEIEGGVSGNMRIAIVTMTQILRRNADAGGGRVCRVRGGAGYFCISGRGSILF